MRLPIAIGLKYKIIDNNNIVLLVDPIDKGNYRWQLCRKNTAVWLDIMNCQTNSCNTDRIQYTSIGDKYRCLVEIKGKVRYFSRTLTISEKLYQDIANRKNNNQSNDYNYNQYRKANDYSKQSNKQYQQQNKEKEIVHSVKETDGMEGLEFERYCSEILKKNGYEQVKTTIGSGDYGIDIIAYKDKISYAIQCKCYSGNVGNKAVQEAFTGKEYYKCMVAVVLTNSHFTQAAKETAQRTSVVLWDREYLDNMIKRAYYSTKDQTQTANNEAFDFFRGCNNLEQVKDRYKKLMQTYHPDTNAGDEDYSKEINNQYELMKRKFNK